MKKIILQLTIIVSLFVQACSQPLEETRLEKYDITITAPKLKSAPEFTDLKVSETDTELSSYDFYIGNRARVDVKEITASVYPADTSMLKEAVTGSEDFVELIETKQLSNGAFGIIFKMKGSSGTTIKHYIFYFKKGNRFFKMEPVFNSELGDLDKQLAAFGSMK